MSFVQSTINSDDYREAELLLFITLKQILEIIKVVYVFSRYWKVNPTM